MLYADIFAMLEAELRRVNYLGPVGIDAFAYRDADGRVRLKPIVEINPRYTMGRLTVELMKHVAPGSRGLFRLVSRKQTLAEGFADFIAYGRSMNERFPIQSESRTITAHQRRYGLPELIRRRRRFVSRCFKSLTLPVRSLRRRT